ncbi:plasmid pRiA4b ORF-3 family protein [Phytoactinopolyspora halotolerans]|uniref:Plasmid pRiA4b ORF-3 family protein n=1 Tax=Phytoactinopolyspora halotolerans TaxID=1981512 RepID=A0A6L9SGQ7_9ACTN|nr:plasmid pRiA4b ORF-3 family protein [Phytoactinopolyspora halotolerans]NEE03768.1 plasmid pRiA4b ORF-3 family protein [Phytoactinopolyspora halotolerans]
MTPKRGHLRLVENPIDDDVAPTSRRSPRRPDTVTYQVRVELQDTAPPLLRRLELASDLFLNDVHDVIQAAVGWTDSHLHQFGSGPEYHSPHTEYYLCPFEREEAQDEGGVPEEDVRLDEVLAEPGDTLFYCYDFGDDWVHVIELEKVLPREGPQPVASCLGGERPGPAEDCGGVPGYEAFAAANDPKHPNHRDAMADLRSMYGDDVDPASHAPVPFDVHEVNRVLDSLGIADLPAVGELPDALLQLYNSVGYVPARRRLRRLIGDARLDAPVIIDVETAEAMVRPYGWLLERVGDDGIKLTAAGYLPPAHVEAAMAELGMEDEWVGKFNREDQTLPVLLLRETAQKLGLLRKYRGRLLLTARARKLRSDPVALWWHLAANLPVKSRDPFTNQAGLLYLVAVAAGAGATGAGGAGAGGGTGGTGATAAAGSVGAIDAAGSASAGRGVAGTGTTGGIERGGGELLQRETLVAELLREAGWRHGDGSPIDHRSVIQSTSDTEYVLRRLGALDKSDMFALRAAQPTPQGITFARAALRNGH